MRFDTSRDVTEDLIKHLEGFESRAYKDDVGHGTIGYGHLLTKKDKDLAGRTLTQREAEDLLRSDISKHQQGYIAGLKRPIPSNQMAALTSFAFNLGAHSKGVERIVDALNKGDEQGAADIFLLYDKVKDRETGVYYTHEGLSKRRSTERALFLTPDGQEFKIPGKGQKTTVSSSPPAPGSLATNEQQKMLALWEGLVSRLNADVANNEAVFDRIRKEGRGR